MFVCRGGVGGGASVSSENNTSYVTFYIAGVVSKFKCNSIILRQEKSKYPILHTVVDLISTLCQGFSYLSEVGPVAC